MFCSARRQHADTILAVYNTDIVAWSELMRVDLVWGDPLLIHGLVNLLGVRIWVQSVGDWRKPELPGIVPFCPLDDDSVGEPNTYVLVFVNTAGQGVPNLYEACLQETKGREGEEEKEELVDAVEHMAEEEQHRAPDASPAPTSGVQSSPRWPPLLRPPPPPLQAAPRPWSWRGWGPAAAPREGNRSSSHLLQQRMPSLRSASCRATCSMSSRHR